ncbi:GH3 auxin-responsive promoter family protein [Thiocystis violascens]|uniref:GH3 auxin-responsive promoter-binding protein n=1 Tax=Thiocystis violascens (strain ATCC 17096 / DSM 198 / 6111) TaxID=765911 RepID=I3YFZ0_THIV6|nr:GH3 auxin-responsive promoter family protein [Thiocystis violascens]AFL75908.1 GH3 auxin-responsive promoter-binding protein [Thiocystis violascens DSM 198]
MTLTTELGALTGPALWQSFAALCERADAVQQEFLLDLIRSNADSRFGREHGFERIASVDDFRRRIPLRDWNDVEPYVTALVAGETEALTSGQPVARFIMTSGTTGTPKLIPANDATQEVNGVTMALRLLGVLRDHPEVLRGDILALANAAVAGQTASGIPYGSASGMSMTRAPAELRQRFAYPPAVLEIKDPASRVYAMLRFALERDLTLAIGNNPLNFTQLFDLLPTHAAALIADIESGTLSTPEPLSDVLRQRLEAELRPNSERAAALRALDVLSARAAWPNLRLIVCWKTGLMGRFLNDLAERCPPGTVFREYGYGASEGLLTIPMSDETSAGVLAIHGIFFEFLPEEATQTPDAPTLLAHELEVGQRYQLILTTAAGLYRYCLGDLVEVQGFLGRAPLVTFLRKVGDVLNLLGEKLDARQVAMAMEAAQRASGLAVRHFQWIADASTLSYELCVEPAAAGESDWRTLIDTFDRELRTLSYGYELRRGNGTFAPPRLRLMCPGWLEALSQGGGYQAKPKIVGYQLAESGLTERLVLPAEPVARD